MAQERRALIGTLVAFSLTPFSARSDDEANRSIAQALFDDGVHILEEARCDDEIVSEDRRSRCREALDKFRRASTLYPSGLGALRNAAVCERGLGLVASAMRDFREVARRAPLDPNPSKQLWAKHALDEADKLDKRVPRVMIAEAGAPPGATIVLDGVTLPPAALGARLPVDPGEHVLFARAPGHLDDRRVFSIAERDDLKLSIDLRPIPKPPLAPPERRSYLGPGLVLGGGATLAVVGVSLGVLAHSSRNDACDTSERPYRCSDADGLDRARSLATASTIVTVAGSALVLFGAGWLVLGGRGQKHVGFTATPIASGTMGFAYGAF